MAAPEVDPFDPGSADPTYHSIHDVLADFGWSDLTELDALADSIDDASPIEDGHDLWFDVIGGEYYLVVDTIGMGLEFPLRRSELIDITVELEADLVHVAGAKEQA